jgi:hypothetical protein
MSIFSSSYCRCVRPSTAKNSLQWEGDAVSIRSLPLDLHHLLRHVSSSRAVLQTDRPSRPPSSSRVESRTSISTRLSSIIQATLSLSLSLSLSSGSRPPTTPLSRTSSSTLPSGSDHPMSIGTLRGRLQAKPFPLPCYEPSSLRGLQTSLTAHTLLPTL